MDAWLTVAVALIVAVSTLGATFMGNRVSSKHFEKELARQREVDERQRKWEVRSEPLLKLRNEFAVMASKLRNFVSATIEYNGRTAAAEDDAKKKLLAAEMDWNAYLSGGDLDRTLDIQYDKDIVNHIEGIWHDFYRSRLYFNELAKGKGSVGLNPTQISEAMNVFERNRNQIMEVQELINKRLEEL